MTDTKKSLVPSGETPPKCASCWRTHVVAILSIDYAPSRVLLHEQRGHVYEPAQ